MKKEFKRGEIVVFGDYEFKFNIEYTVMGNIRDQYWSVKVTEDSKNKEYFDSIPEFLMGYPIKNIHGLFEGCYNIKELPIIKAKVPNCRISTLISSDIFKGAPDHPFYKDHNGIIYHSWFGLKLADKLQYWNYSIDENEKAVKLHKFSTRKFDEESIFIPSEIEGYKVILDPKIRIGGKTPVIEEDGTITEKEYFEPRCVGLFSGTFLRNVIFDDNISYSEYAFVKMFEDCKYLENVYNIPKCVKHFEAMFYKCDALDQSTIRRFKEERF